MRNLPVLIILFLLLLLRLYLFFDDQKIYKENDIFETVHTFNHEPKKSIYGQYFFSDNILISVPSFPSYEFGDKVKIKGVVKIKRSEKAEILIVNNPEIKMIDNSTSLLALVKPIRQRIEDSVLVSISAKEGSLLLGILLGVRDKIEKDYYERLKSVGVLHVIAASGQNVSIVASLLLLMFERIARRKLALLLTVLGLAFYALLTGFEPPIIRASIMAVFALGALMTGRQKQSINFLILTAILMLVISPSLLTDISFQLSFMSTWGIIAVKPILDSLVNLNRLKIIKEDVTTTLSAQIATFPLMISVFSSYSWISFPVNIAILWTVPFIMIFGGIGAILSLILPILGLPFYLLTFPFLRYFGHIVDFASQYSLVSRFESIPLSIIIGYYLILVTILFKLGQKKKNA